MSDKYSVPEQTDSTVSNQWWKANSIIGLAIIIFLFVVALSAGLAYFSLNQQPNPTRTPTPTPIPSQAQTTPTSLPSLTPSVTPTGQGNQSGIKVYFSKHPESDNNFQLVFPVSRTTSDPGVAKAALDQLIAGPTNAESQQGLFSDWKLSGSSNCGGDDFSLNISSGKATMKLCKDFNSAGIGQDARAQSEADATLKQFSTVTKTVYLDKNGNCLFDQSGQNQCLK